MSPPTKGLLRKMFMLSISRGLIKAPQVKPVLETGQATNTERFTWKTEL